jgi:hypothetical protein
MKLYKHISIFALVLAMATTMILTSNANAQTSRSAGNGSGKIGDINFNNVTLDNPMFRLGEAGLLLDNGGMSIEGQIGISTTGYRGRRLVCMVEPIIEGSYMEDNIGQCTAIYAFTPTAAQFSGNLSIAIPYSWLGMDLRRNSKITEPKNLQIQVTLVDWKSEKVLDTNTFDITADKMQFDGNNVPMNMLSSLFGGGVDGDVVHTCTACDGTGVCNSCYGDAYLDPSTCRKCATNPGVCRRCKGKGKEGAELQESGGLFDLFF